MGAAAWWVNENLNSLMEEIFISNIISLIAAILSGIVFYAILVNFVRIKEVTTLRNKLLSMISNK